MKLKTSLRSSKLPPNLTSKSSKSSPLFSSLQWPEITLENHPCLPNKFNKSTLNGSVLHPWVGVAGSLAPWNCYIISQHVQSAELGQEEKLSADENLEVSLVPRSAFVRCFLGTQTMGRWWEIEHWSGISGIGFLDVLKWNYLLFWGCCYQPTHLLSRCFSIKWKAHHSIIKKNSSTYFPFKKGLEKKMPNPWEIPTATVIFRYYNVTICPCLGGCNRCCWLDFPPRSWSTSHSEKENFQDDNDQVTWW